MCLECASEASELANIFPTVLMTSGLTLHVFCNVNLIRFEAGTPAIGEAVGLGAAVDYLNSIGMDCIHEYEVLVLLIYT